MTRSEDDRLDRPDESEVPPRKRKDPHPSEIIPGVFGRRLGIEGVPRQKDEAPAKPTEPRRPR